MFSRLTVECGVRYKHNNIKNMQNTQSYYSTELYKYFICSIRGIFKHQKFINRMKGVNFLYLLSATLICAFYFLRLTELNIKLMKILTSALLWKKKSWHLFYEDGSAIVMIPYSLASPLQRRKLLHNFPISCFFSTVSSLTN
jgi:hypothetical protein